jgi:hypothetical protein
VPAQGIGHLRLRPAEPGHVAVIAEHYDPVAMNCRAILLVQRTAIML